MTAKPLRARTTFWYGQRCVNQGDIVSSEDPVAKGDRSLLFEEVTLPSVEQATAAPGERRFVTRPKKED